ncbi:MAG: gamma-glutamylcyclotransferase [Deltaproteobacteria bacterium]|nr:gamma-glutamylcyclotransferase [Deltaproteobacteria bacterium]
MERYFAYGSNLEPRRFRERVGGFQVHGVACLHGQCLAFNKRGRDGSGKANLMPDPLGLVWGVVYELAPTAWPTLDQFEGGYTRLRVQVERGPGEGLEAWTYASSRLSRKPPFAWYREHVVQGARYHGLPDDWVAWLEGVIVQPDSSREI